MRFSFYEKPGWFFRWESPQWRIEPGFEAGGRFAVYTSRNGKTQVFKLYRHNSKYGEGWTPVDLTGFWIKSEEACAGAPIGAFLRELDTIASRLLPGLDKYIPHKTYDSQVEKYCNCLLYQEMGCLVHSPALPKCECNPSELLSFGCRCGGI